MKNYICTGERINVTAPSGGLTAGQVYLVGTKVCVIVSGGLEGETVVAMTEGVFELTKATGAVSIGQALYWDDSAKKITTTAAGNTYAGYAYKAALSGDATVYICIVDNPAALNVSQAAVIAALGTITPLTAIAGTYADLAAARTSVNSLRGEVETRLANIEAKVDALLASLKAASIMASA